ncbi:MAG: tetratricopeptide repeat protein [Sphingobacteriales bacterium]|nr:MAG: tetratricopeptide repeat protein [Sphingobacteriales bacterium]
MKYPFLVIIAFLLVLSVAKAQEVSQTMLLTDITIQLESTDAVNAMYNFKYAEAEAKFNELKRRYPYHPMPYFLLGLSEWWKIVPTNIKATKYDDKFFAYMDSSIYFAEKLYEENENNVEAAFFLSAAYGFKGRLHSERKNWRKATVSGKEALNYMEKAKQGSNLSPELLFGDALFNYYAVWIKENYPLLRPILLFFPDGDKKKGIEQLSTVAVNAFYTRTEAQFFLMKILANEENNPQEAMKYSRYLATTFPDNAYFQRFYARQCYVLGEITELEKVSKEILDKLNRKMPGYEEISGRYASFFLGYVYQYRYKKPEEAKKYYLQSVVYAKNTDEEKSGYNISALVNLGRIADKQENYALVREYFKEVTKLADNKSSAHKEAKEYLKKKQKKKKK